MIRSTTYGLARVSMMEIGAIICSMAKAHIRGLMGEKYVGAWKQNEFSGSGVHSWNDGRKYSVFYADNKKHGKGTYNWLNGTI
jgi:hypothetical protein